MKRLVGLGACVYDTLITCAEYPAEDTKKKSERVFHSGGGPVGNALVIASKLGLDCSVVGAFADDAAGRFLLDDFKKYGGEHGRREKNFRRDYVHFLYYTVRKKQNANLRV